MIIGKLSIFLIVNKCECCILVFVRLWLEWSPPWAKRVRLLQFWERIWIQRPQKPSWTPFHPNCTNSKKWQKKRPYSFWSIFDDFKVFAKLSYPWVKFDEKHDGDARLWSNHRQVHWLSCVATETVVRLWSSQRLEPHDIYVIYIYFPSKFSLKFIQYFFKFLQILLKIYFLV